VAWPLTLVAVIAVVVLGVMLLRRVRGAATGRQHPRPS
jgi:uncharacterized protein (DUF983 family)